MRLGRKVCYWPTPLRQIGATVMVIPCVLLLWGEALRQALKAFASEVRWHEPNNSKVLLRQYVRLLTTRAKEDQ